MTVRSQMKSAPRPWMKWWGSSISWAKTGSSAGSLRAGQVPNLVFYGPSGTGKTTVANIIANTTRRTLHRLNATTATIGDIREVIADVDTLMAPNGVLLYLDGDPVL